MRRLEKRADGYELVEIEAIDELDLEAFLPVVDESWQKDYRDQPRQRFTEAVLRKLTPEGAWVGVLALAPSGDPVGFELAMERVLRVRGRTLHAFYASVFTVAVEHRRRGLGSWVLEGINRLVFQERHADVIVSTLHHGHAGSPTVETTFDRIANWGVRRLHETRIWSRRLDREPLPPLESPQRTCRVALDRSAAAPRRLQILEGDLDFPLPELSDLDRRIGDAFDVSFALEASLAGQYLEPENDASGVLLFEREGRDPALAGFNLMPMAINDHSLRPVGQLQFLHAPGASHARFERLVHQVAVELAERGCFAMSLLDMGMVPQTVLERLGFAATEDRVDFAIRGPVERLELFAEARPPFFLDFT